MNNNGGTQMVTDKPMGEIRTRVGKILLREDGIVQLVIDPKAEYTLADIGEGNAGILQASNGQQRPVLVDARDIKSVDFAARKEAANFAEITSVAVLIHSMVSRMIGNVFISANKPSIPVRLFNSEAEAIEWLKEFLK